MKSSFFATRVGLSLIMGFATAGSAVASPVGDTLWLTPPQIEELQSGMQSVEGLHPVQRSIEVATRDGRKVTLWELGETEACLGLRLDVEHVPSDLGASLAVPLNRIQFEVRDLLGGWHVAPGRLSLSAGEEAVSLEAISVGVGATAGWASNPALGAVSATLLALLDHMGPTLKQAQLHRSVGDDEAWRDLGPERRECASRVMLAYGSVIDGVVQGRLNGGNLRRLEKVLLAETPRY
ncbi:MAG TPA: hypothetical protein VL588_12905 [Bdellovibrionota bacterium]|nr:hypothetical protein [Bdellovibrionota bacterium]